MYAESDTPAKRCVVFYVYHICKRVLAHMALFIGDMHLNGIHHISPPDDLLASYFIVLNI